MDLSTLAPTFEAGAVVSILLALLSLLLVRIFNAPMQGVRPPGFVATAFVYGGAFLALGLAFVLAVLAPGFSGIHWQYVLVALQWSAIYLALRSWIRLCA